MGLISGIHYYHNHISSERAYRCRHVMESERRSGDTGAFFSPELNRADPDLAAAIGREVDRQRCEIELIASENIVSRAVLEAAGSPLTNKYAEGYPGKRYYGGCQFVDEAETLAIERAKKLFNCSFANVQPNSGSQANQAVLLALVKSERHDPRPVARGRRAPDAWRGSQSLGQMVQRASLHRACRRSAHRHG